MTCFLLKHPGKNKPELQCIPFGPNGSTAKFQALRSDLSSVRDDLELIDWDLKLAALSTDEPQRLVRFLTGALVACGGWVLSRSICEAESAEMSFEFPRSSCVEIYAVLIAAGLELGRESHLRMMELCLCTKNLLESKAFDIARINLSVGIVHAAQNSSSSGEHQPQVA
ncbi:hypothetical protein [Acidipila rosea]|uniref:hypothetical protein n=1 Tax=Acidipila rosea TaxID=768535 RepID=UPI00104887EA|nr:hypothetical protein [Acidipila rosea]